MAPGTAGGAGGAAPQQRQRLQQAQEAAAAAAGLPNGQVQDAEIETQEERVPETQPEPERAVSIVFEGESRMPPPAFLCLAARCQLWRGCCMVC